MGWRKAYSLGLGSLVLISVTVFAFQNCAPEQYFRAVKTEDENNGSSSNPPPPPPEGNRYYITVGEFKPTPAATAAGLAIGGRMMMVRDSISGATESFTHVYGLTPSAPAPIHVHDNPCNIAGGGAHYKFDEAVSLALVDNEIWPQIAATDVNGIGSGYARSNKHYARPEAQSMVIHANDAPTNTRLACGLMHSTRGSTTYGGNFVRLPAAVAGQLVPGAVGNAVISRLGNDTLTIVRASLSGLAPGTTYNAHVHAFACNQLTNAVAGTEGGGHYRRDLDIVEQLPLVNGANEIWLPFTTSAAVNGTGGGYASVRVQVPHVARNFDATGIGTGANSIVVHDPTVGSTARILCVDLTAPGGFVRTDLGNQRFPNLSGAAKMERLPTGETKVTLTGVAGLAPNSRFTAHVHDRPCHISGGGGHYKHDYAIATTVEANEVFLYINTDAAGGGSAVALAKKILRPEAYSVVIHDNDAPANTRLACADLYQ